MLVKAPIDVLLEPSQFWGQDELQLAIQNTLAALADVDTHFQSELNALAEWAGPEHTKARIARELAQDHERNRAPYVAHLASLEGYMKSVFKAVH